MITDQVYDSYKDTAEHIQNVRTKLFKVVEDLLTRSLVHDASKLQSPEKEYYDNHSQSLRTLEYGSPEYKAALVEMQPGIDHHYSENDHHPEYYVDSINGMNLLSMIEMLCDWKAAGERHVDKHLDIFQSIEINAKRFGITDQLKQILLNTATYLWYQ